MKRTTCWIASILCLLPFALLSQANTDDNLYTVEVIIFERLENTANPDPENWPKNLKLSYPENWQRLLDPIKEAERRKKLLQKNAQEKALEDKWALSDGFLQALANEEQAENPSGAPAPKTHQPAPQTTEIEAQEADSADETAGGPRYFEYFTRDQHALNNTRNALNRDRNLRVLFHNTWLQPLQAKENAPALILTGGNEFGEHYELEGSITLYLSRYIHISTDLWLTQFIPNHGQQSDHWPQLPASPSEINDLYNRLTSDITLAPLTTLNTQATLNTQGFTSTTTSPANKGYASEAASNIYTSALSNSGTAQIRSPQEPNLTGSTLSNMNNEDVIAPYLTNQIITLRQTRRMRSKELHYIDHPKLGLLIQVLPYTAPEPDTDSTASLSMN